MHTCAAGEKLRGREPRKRGSDGVNADSRKRAPTRTAGKTLRVREPCAARGERGSGGVSADSRKRAPTRTAGKTLRGRECRATCTRRAYSPRQTVAAIRFSRHVTDTRTGTFSVTADGERIPDGGALPLKPGRVVNVEVTV